MEPILTRTEIAQFIAERLEAERAKLADFYGRQPVPYFVIDNLLPPELARAIAGSFPDVAGLVLKKSLRELKYVTAQMDRCQSILEETVFAFHDARVVELVAAITGLTRLEPDRQLYVGGISIMSKGHFLSPHLDNSHDRQRERYRALNLLYYASPEWDPGQGGSLELWPQGPTGTPVTLPNLFNRLIVMATTRGSWHSVPKIKASQPRYCVSNYYFSPDSPEKENYFHVTSFRGRPEQPLRDLALRVDIALRMFLRRLRPRGIVQNKHYYARPDGRPRSE
jgi:Rps23 Pro-64 3,4-dihydroxylase Tpa1-like proline 4-hydroxylase